MSISNNPELSKALENNEFDKAVNIYLKTNIEEEENRLKSISAAIELSNQDLSEKTKKKIIAAIIESLKLKPDSEWAKNAYNYMISSLPDLEFSNKDKANIYKIISEYNEELAPNSGKRGLIYAGNEYHSINQFELAREVYNKAQDYVLSYQMFMEEISYNFEEYNISKAIRILEELTNWNRATNYMEREKLFDFWYNNANSILETLTDTEKFLNIKIKVNKEESISLLHKSVWEQAVAVNKGNREVWEWYFQQSLTLEMINLMDYWVEQGIIHSIFELHELGVLVSNQLNNLNLESRVEYSSLFIRRFQEDEDLLRLFADFLEKSYSPIYDMNLQVNLINQVIFLFQHLKDTNKMVWWKFQRASVFYRLKDFENTIKELEEIGSMSKNNRDIVNTIGDHFLTLSTKIASSKNFEVAEQSFNILVTMYQSIGDMSKAGKILGDQAALFFEHGQKNANNILNESLNLLSAEEYNSLKGEIHQKVGESLVNVDQEDEALNHFKKANEYYLSNKSNSIEFAKSLGTLLEVKSRNLLQERKKRKLYDKYYDFTESMFQSWDLSEELSKTLVFELTRLIDSKIEPESIATMAEKTGKRLKSFQEIDLFAKMLQSYIDFLIERNDLVNASNMSTILLSTLENLNQIELIKKYGVALAMNFYKIQETIIAEDVLEKAIDAFDRDDDFLSIGDALVEAAYILARVKNHDQAVATFGRAIPFYEDVENSKKIEDTIAKCLEIAKLLSNKGKEEAHLYIKKANDIMNQTGIKLSDTITDTVYSSYSDHLLNKTEEIIKERYTPRRKRKKREFNIFKRKTDEF